MTARPPTRMLAHLIIDFILEPLITFLASEGPRISHDSNESFT